MRVLIITQYFPPETGGPQNRLASIVGGFVEVGHQVTVITEKPCYPIGIIWDEYRGGLFKESQFAGARVIHTWVRGDRSKRFVSRLLFFLSFMVMAVAATFRVRGRQDVVLASSPPLFVGLAGWIASRLNRAVYVFDVRDLWPDLAIAIGELEGGAVAQLAKRLEHFIYRRADLVTAVTDGFCAAISASIGYSRPVTRVSNGTVVEAFAVDDDIPTLRERLGLDTDATWIGYVGNLGLNQGLDHVVEAAPRLQSEHPEVRVLFVGEGPVRDRLMHRARDLDAGNLVFVGGVTPDVAASYMAACDGLLVPLGAHPIYQSFVPSKLYDSMAAGKPVLLSVDGEARTILEAAGAGWYYEAESADGLVSAISTLRADLRAARERGAAGRDFVATHFTRRAEARKLIDAVASVVDQRA